MREIMARTVSFGVSGVSGFKVSVEVFGIDSMPGMEIIGLPDTSVRESKDRVNAAIINSGREMKARRITVNLAPADMKKEGPFRLCDCVSKKNLPSLKTHEKCGFRIVSEEGYDYLLEETDDRDFGLEYRYPEA